MDTLINVDVLIRRLLYATDHSPAELEANDILNLCRNVSKIFLEESTLVYYNENCHVIGDIRGNYNGLIKILLGVGHPKNTNYVFLGNYVDKKPRSVETILLLFCFKVKYPKKIILLRGSHECSMMNTGFFNECRSRFGNTLIYEALNCTFDYLPLAALVKDKVFCCHGGIPQHLERLNDLNAIQRPLSDWQKNTFAQDLLWADPDRYAIGYEYSSEKTISYFFGHDALNRFLKKHNISLVCRGRQCTRQGYKFFNKKKLATIYSSNRSKVGVLSISDSIDPNSKSIECHFSSLSKDCCCTIIIPLQGILSENKADENGQGDDDCDENDHDEDDETLKNSSSEDEKEEEEEERKEEDEGKEREKEEKEEEKEDEEEGLELEREKKRRREMEREKERFARNKSLNFSLEQIIEEPEKEEEEAEICARLEKNLRF